MSVVAPSEVVAELIDAAEKKASLGWGDLLLRGFLSGALLAAATMVAFTVTEQAGSKSFVGALVFPVGFVMIMLMGLELVTGNFATLPMALAAKRIGIAMVGRNWLHVYLANLVGSVVVGALLWLGLSKLGHIAPVGSEYLVSVAKGKTLAYKELGSAGMLVAFVKAVLCNWLVTLGVVMAFSSRDTVGKVLAIWLPIFTFFAMGLEHSVVNMFVIPTAMLFGAQISFVDWWLWNQIPVTLGNIVGAVFFTGLPLWWTHRRRS